MRFGLIKGQLRLARIWFFLHSWSVTSVTQHGSARDWTAVRMAEEPEPEPSWTAVDVSNDADGDGIPDYAHPLMLMVDADGDGVSDGLHSDKLGRFLPEAKLCNERPYFVRESDRKYFVWWAGGRWWLGPASLLGHKKGWLKAARASKSNMPPEEGWLVYHKAEKEWREMDGMMVKPELPPAPDYPAPHPMPVELDLQATEDHSATHPMPVGLDLHPTDSRVSQSSRRRLHEHAR